jgi:CheY-like chemotaxis protein
MTPAILVVDDNAAKRLAVRAMLAPLGHAVIEAESGRWMCACRRSTDTRPPS